jgi:hypothetical protein
VIPEVLEKSDRLSVAEFEDHCLAYSLREGMGIHATVMLAQLRSFGVIEGNAHAITSKVFFDTYNWEAFTREYVQYRSAALELVRVTPIETCMVHGDMCSVCRAHDTCNRTCIPNAVNTEHAWLVNLEHMLAPAAAALVERVFCHSEARSRYYVYLFRFPLLPNGVYAEIPMTPPTPVIAIEGDEGADRWSR